MAPKGPKSILYIVMLHSKSKVMSRIQWCKNFAPRTCPGGLQRSKSRILDLFFFFFCLNNILFI